MQGTIDGFDLAQKLRAAQPDLPILLIAANAGIAEKDPVRHTVSHVLQKPVPRQVLYRILMEMNPTKAMEPSKEAMVFHARQRRETPALTTDARRQLRVLAAEDNKTNQLVFGKMLKELDVELLFASNGIEAVSLYDSFTPDIVFMDISMPKKDGKAATQEIRGKEKTTGTHIPIVAMTAHAMSGDQEAILDAGLDRFLTKPLKKALVIEQIEQVQVEGTRPIRADQAG